MIEAKGKTPSRFAADEFPLRLHEPSDSEPLEPLQESVDSRPTPLSRMPLRNDSRMRRLATDVIAAVQSQLPGRIRDLKVRIESEQVVLSGVSSSYYVKQVAQHVAMTTIEAVTLCQLVNEIEVRPTR
jgi:hypothetical protein